MAVGLFLLLSTALFLFTVTVHGFSTQSPGRIAYVTILSSDDFAEPAIVLSSQFRLLNSSIPFIVFYTEDVNDTAVARLLSHDVVVRPIDKVATPYASDHPAKKFEYSKIRLWCETSLDVMVYVDLDTLPLVDTSELFDCGSFCASLRHSNRFNSGVFVLRPDRETCLAMNDTFATLASYDGGDQGFLNSFFWQVAFASMYDPFNVTGQAGGEQSKTSLLRIGAEYNFDIGMYYLAGRALVKPKIIHYTMGSIKPWNWYSYPLFDLTTHWLEARNRALLDDDTILGYVGAFVVTALYLFIVLGFIGLLYAALSRCCYPLKAVHPAPLIVLAYLVAFACVVTTVPPFLGWLFFTFNLVIALTCVALVVVSAPPGQPHAAPVDARQVVRGLLLLAAVTIIPVPIAYRIAIAIEPPHARFLACALAIAVHFFGVYYAIYRLQITQNRPVHRRYAPLITRDG